MGPLSSLLLISSTNVCSTTAGLAAITAATAAAAVGIAYWSSSTNTSSVGTVLLEILRATGCDIQGDNNEEDDDDGDDSIITSDIIKKNKDCNTNNTMNDKEAFLLSLLDEKDDEYDNGFYAHDDEDFTNTRWISETIHDAIVSTTGTTITKKKK